MRNHDARKAAVLYGAFAAAWLVVLFFFSGQTGYESGELSRKVTQLLFGWLVDRGVPFNTLHILTRKLAHFGIFAVEGWLLGSALLRLLPARRAVLLTTLGCAAIAALNELHQLTSADRSCDIRDVLIDSIGAMVGFAFAVVIWHAFSAFKRRKAKIYITTGD